MHGQARVILYVKEEMKIKMIPLARELTDLPCITCQIGTGKENFSQLFLQRMDLRSIGSGRGQPTERKAEKASTALEDCPAG